MPTTHRISTKMTIALSAALSLGLVLSAAAAGKTVLLKNAPSAVQKTIAEQLKGGGTLHKLSVEVANGKTQYDAVIKEAGKKDRDVLVAPDGTLIEAKK